MFRRVQLKALPLLLSMPVWVLSPSSTILLPPEHAQLHHAQLLPALQRMGAALNSLNPKPSLHARPGHMPGIQACVLPHCSGVWTPSSACTA